MSVGASAHDDLVLFARRVACHSEDLGENTFGVKLLADLWLEAGQELTTGTVPGEEREGER